MTSVLCESLESALIELTDDELAAVRDTCRDLAAADAGRPRVAALWTNIVDAARVHRAERRLSELALASSLRGHDTEQVPESDGRWRAACTCGWRSYATSDLEADSLAQGHMEDSEVGCGRRYVQYEPEAPRAFLALCSCLTWRVEAVEDLADALVLLRRHLIGAGQLVLADERPPVLILGDDSNPIDEQVEAAWRRAVAATEE